MVKILKTYGLVIGLAALIAILFRLFVFEAYRIPTDVMHPTLEPGDTIFVSKSDFGLRVPFTLKRLTSGRSPERGEVVVFAYPDAPNTDFIKRVLAIGGDEVEIREGQLILNGKSVWRSKSPEDLCGEEVLESRTFRVCRELPMIERFGPLRVPPGHVFVLGDLRSKRAQSKSASGIGRSWGVISENSLKGRAVWVWLSLDSSSSRTEGGFSRLRLERTFLRIQ